MVEKNTTFFQHNIDENPSETLQDGRCLDPFARAYKAYARAGIPVFRCKRDSKNPLEKRGFYAATTGIEELARRAGETPRANIAMPTGKLVVLDVDPESGGLESLQGLIEEHGQLPETKTVRTRLGGYHFYFVAPEGVDVPSSAGALGPGLDVRGKGGYVLLPPSYVSDEKGAGSYVALNKKVPAAPMPCWLVNLTFTKAAEKCRPTDGAKKAGSTAIPETGPIPNGRRNATLTSVAGRLHDGRTLDNLVEALEQVNRDRCEPPLPEFEVRAIAQSIYRLEPCTPKLAALEVLEVLGGVEQAMEAAADDWKGVGGRTDYDVMDVILALCARHGKLVKDGVWFSLSSRQLSEEVNSHYTSAANSLRRLIEGGWLKVDPRSKKRGRANSYILKAPAQAAYSHRLCSNYDDLLDGCMHLARRASVGGLGYPPPLRWSCPGYLRLGRTCGRVIKALYLRGGTATVEGIAEVLGSSRPRDVRSRYLARLEERGIVEVEGQSVSLVEDWTANLTIERGQMGEFEAAERTRDKNERDRVAFRDFLAGKNKPYPTPEIAGKHKPECSCETCAEEHTRGDDARPVYDLQPEQMGPLEEGAPGASTGGSEDPVKVGVETSATALMDLARERFGPVEDPVTPPAPRGVDPLAYTRTHKARFFARGEGWRDVPPHGFKVHGNTG